MKHLPEIYITPIKHKNQRYDTAGDYFEIVGGWEFRISRMNADYEFLVTMHELTEWYLTQKSGIKEKDITKFDIESGLDDPGASKKAPYHKQHMFAEKIEKLIAKELKVDWKEYMKSFDNLKYGRN